MKGVTVKREKRIFANVLEMMIGHFGPIHGTRRIFYRFKIRAFRVSVHTEPRLTYENLDASPFKYLNAQIGNEVLAGKVKNLTGAL